MLVLSRKLGERIHIGNGITITVVAVQGRQVRLGIEAPRGVSIRREELDLRPRPRETRSAIPVS
jgi:carbon storage regulator